MKVLVVDDDGTCRLVTQAMVVALGYGCVVIADRRMPGLNAVQLCQLIRGQTLGRNVHVILATAMKECGEIVSTR